MAVSPVRMPIRNGSMNRGISRLRSRRISRSSRRAISRLILIGGDPSSRDSVRGDAVVMGGFCIFAIGALAADHAEIRLLERRPALLQGKHVHAVRDGGT